VSYEVIVEPPARRDIRTAFEWYENRTEGMGSVFLRAVATAIERLTREPTAYRLERQLYRRIRLRKFPYALHYEVAPSHRVFVLACLHFRQSPDIWPGA
jgi:plasmid stabilization system protein ParE